jgi:flavin reductase (DIM6/NTAB) family NADH-FMN oxidoreductase RutF
MSNTKEGEVQPIISRALSHGVYIVTVRAGEKRNGMTAAWVSQVSFSPLLLMLSIAPERFSYGLIKETGFFGINTLDEDLQNYAAIFGFRSGKHADKFQGIPYSDAPNGSPILDGAVAFCECKLTDTFTAGDHSLFIGQVLEARLLNESAEPLIFHWDDYF